jgi:carboxypeptidase C (cathepsin A)
VPLIVWLQGGPGASSQFGCFNEVGPLAIEGAPGNLKPAENVWGWITFGHVMCVDQPVGTGFSYSNSS